MTSIERAAGLRDRIEDLVGDQISGTVLYPEIDALIAAAIDAAVAADRTKWAAWLALAFTAIDRHVPISQIPDGLDAAREALEDCP